MTPSCHVVIVAYHSLDYVRACVANLEPRWCRSITIVDNSASASERQALAAIDSEIPISVIDAGGNIGFGAGANLGVAALPDEDAPIWLLNPDTKPVAGALAKLLDVLVAGDSDAVSPLLVTGDHGETVWYAGGSVDSRTGRVRHHGHGDEASGVVPGREPVTFLCGAAPLFTRDAWRRIGGFDESLFLYWEDVELSLRAADNGVRMHVVRDAVVWHAVGGTSGEEGQSLAFYRGSAKNRVATMRRRRGLRSVLWGAGLLTTLRLACHPFVHESDNRLGKFRAFVAGFADGLRVPALDR